MRQPTINPRTRQPSDSQVLADSYSRVGGHQLLVCVYDAQFILYAQVTERTAGRLAKVLCMLKPFVQIEDGALSADGLTYCWTFQASRLTPPKGDWVGCVMYHVSNLVRIHAPQLLGPDDSVSYQDNRGLDMNTVESYAQFLRENRLALEAADESPDSPEETK